MDDFQQEVIERLTRIETKIAMQEAQRARSWSLWLVLLPIAISLVVSLGSDAVLR